MSLITTHVLDTAAGEPAVDVPVILEYSESPQRPWIFLNQGRTDANGRLKNLLVAGEVLRPGLYRLRFDTAPRSPFFPEIVVQFAVSDPQRHYHVPLVLTRFGYSTYRGS